MKNIIVRKIRNYVVGLLCLLILGGVFSLYQKLVPFFLDTTPILSTCDAFYERPMENRWLSLQKCELDYSKVFIKSINYKKVKLSEVLLIGLRPIGVEARKISEPIAFEISDDAVVEEFKKVGYSKNELIKLVAKYESKIYTGVVEGRSSLEQGKEGNKIFYYAFKVGKKPELPVKSLQFLLTCVLVLILIFTLERKIKGSD